jgi:hypothetical protein
LYINWSVHSDLRTLHVLVLKFNHIFTSHYQLFFNIPVTVYGNFSEDFLYKYNCHFYTCIHLSWLNQFNINKYTVYYILFYFNMLLYFRHPLSSMVFGTNALITKPAISLAPMLTVSVLNRFGYEQLKAATSSTVLSSSAYHELQAAMFTVTCATPVVIGLLQLAIWTLYTIRHSHVRIPKHTESL